MTDGAPHLPPPANAPDCGKPDPVGTVTAWPYRYTLSRHTGVLAGEGTVLFVMLNPSTADASTDDPTIRRCVDFARRWGYEQLLVGNLYALRATNPRELHQAEDPIGPLNQLWLEVLSERADAVIVAWGAVAHPVPDLPGLVLRQLARRHNPILCLGQTKDGHPRHPLYLANDTERVEFAR